MASGLSASRARMRDDDRHRSVGTLSWALARSRIGGVDLWTTRFGENNEFRDFMQMKVNDFARQLNATATEAIYAIRHCWMLVVELVRLSCCERREFDDRPTINPSEQEQLD